MPTPAEDEERAERRRLKKMRKRGSIPTLANLSQADRQKLYSQYDATVSAVTEVLRGIHTDSRTD